MLGIIIAVAAALLILLLIVLVVALLVMSRRRRLSKAQYKSSAHDNPTYMTHRDLNANLAATGGASPVDLMFDVDGVFGAMFSADDDEKKKVIN